MTRFSSAAGPNSRPAVRIAVAVLPLVALGLAGCRHDPPHRTATAAELRPRLQAAAAETEKVLGRSFATVRPGLGPAPCSTAADTGDGYQFILDQCRARRDADRLAMAKQIETFWRTKKYRVDSYTDQRVTRIRAHLTAGSLDLQLAIATNDITLRGSTDCVQKAEA